MRAILVDDEPIALEVLQSALSTYEEIEIIGSYTNPITALESMAVTQPDVIFLDIELGSVNGLEMADDFLREKDSVEIVFVTAYSQYAIGAFEVNAIDYILKPPQRRRLDKTIKRIQTRLQEKSEEKLQGKFLTVRCLGKFEVKDDTGNPILWRTKKTKELFALLLLEEELSKDLIVEAIFPDKSFKNANTLLHTTIYQLRRAFIQLGFSNSIEYSNGNYKLNLPMDCDFLQLDELLKKHVDEQNILTVLNIYQGDFLEYEGYSWALSVQQNYRESTRDMLFHYVRTQLEKNDRRILLGDILKLLYHMEPFNNDIALLIIEYLGEVGHLDKLKAFFEDYRNNLWSELNLKPLESTLNVYEKYIHMN